MPSFVNSTFTVDLPTLCAVTVFITVTGGLLLLFAWLQNRSEPALALWGLAYLLGSAGAGTLAMVGLNPQAWSTCFANALLCCGYGVLWGAARSFEGRALSFARIFAGAAIWIAACQLPAFDGSVRARVALVSAIFAVYVMLAAREVWQARDRELISRWPTLALLVVHAGFLLARVVLAGMLTVPPLTNGPHHAGVFVMAFEALFVTYCLAFLRVSMAKERAELQQRKAALTDSLTGIANRRGFFESGARLIERTAVERRPTALLLFDLDRFKEVNDTEGHEAGDRVLQVFSKLIARSMRPGDLCARLGGEEFVCLLVDTPMAAAMQLAERLRGKCAATRFAGLKNSITVSVGIAMASETSRDLSVLLANADRALYRAKAEGRNRVASAPFALVEGSGEGTRHPSALGEAAPIPAPLAG
ncbi:MAG TPA: GGDEF domain-containing protein [Xanthobacteraceae bacterium]|nr:GGDEF domain-containing protein [Xanthobacteraceae bacterium]